MLGALCCVAEMYLGGNRRQHLTSSVSTQRVWGLLQPSGDLPYSPSWGHWQDPHRQAFCRCLTDWTWLFLAWFADGLLCVSHWSLLVVKLFESVCSRKSLPLLFFPGSSKLFLHYTFTQEELLEDSATPPPKFHTIIICAPNTVMGTRWFLINV